MERTPDTNQTTDKIPHSGNLPGELRETPINNFDNTPLSDAPLNELNIQDILPTEVLPVAEKKKSKKGLLIGASAGLAGVALVAGSIIGINAANSGEKENEAPAADPKATTETVNVPEVNVEIEPSYEDIVGALEIESGLTAEKYAQELVDAFSEWDNAGAKDTLIDDVVEANEPGEIYLPRLANNNREVFADALFVSTWRDDELLTKWADRIEEINLNTLQIYMATAWNQDTKPENIEGFKRTTTFISAEEISSDDISRTVRITMLSAHNGDKNSAGPSTPAQQTLEVTTVSDNGTEKISGYNFID